MTRALARPPFSVGRTLRVLRGAAFAVVMGGRRPSLRFARLSWRREVPTGHVVATDAGEHDRVPVRDSPCPDLPWGGSLELRWRPLTQKRQCLPRLRRGRR